MWRNTPTARIFRKIRQVAVRTVQMYCKTKGRSLLRVIIGINYDYMALSLDNMAVDPVRTEDYNFGFCPIASGSVLVPFHCHNMFYPSYVYFINM